MSVTKDKTSVQKFYDEIVNTDHADIMESLNFNGILWPKHKLQKVIKLIVLPKKSTFQWRLSNLTSIILQHYKFSHDFPL